MPINAGSMGTVQYFGTNKPGPGVKPIRTGSIPAEAKRPFGVKPGIDWMTGKHIKLGNPEDGSEPTVALSELSDTDLSQDSTEDNPAPADGDALVYDASTEQWKAVNRLLSTLRDVDVVPEGGDVLVYDSTDGKWKTANLPLSILEDGGATPADGDVLVYDLTTNVWKPFTIPKTTLDDGTYDPVETEYSTSTGVLRYRTRQFVVESGFLTLGAFGSWTTIDTAEGCP